MSNSILPKFILCLFLTSIFLVMPYSKLFILSSFHLLPDRIYYGYFQRSYSKLHAMSYSKGTLCLIPKVFLHRSIFKGNLTTTSSCDDENWKGHGRNPKYITIGKFVKKNCQNRFNPSNLLCPLTSSRAHRHTLLVCWRLAKTRLCQVQRHLGRPPGCRPKSQAPEINWMIKLCIFHGTTH